MVVRKTMRKELLREIRGSINRFLSIFVMVALGVMFLVGLRSAAPDMRHTADAYFDDARFYDVEIFSTLGLTGADIEAFSQVNGVEVAEGSISIDAFLTLGENQKTVKALGLSKDDDFDRPELLEGRLPEQNNECALDAKLQTVMDVAVGDTVTLTPGEDMADALSENTYTVTGIVNSPRYISLDRGTSTLGDGSVSGFVLLPRETFSLEFCTGCEIRAAGAAELDAYGTAYQEQIDDLTARLETVAQERAALRYETLRKDAQQQIDQAEADLQAAEEEAGAQLTEAEVQLETVRTTLDDGKQSLEQAKAYGLLSAAEITAMEAELESGEAEYAQGLLELETARQEAEEALSEGRKQLQEAKEALEKLRPADVYVLDRNSNYGFVSYDQNAERMENLARMFPVIFFVVAALVCLTTMTRMVEEERTQIGSIKAMGYGTAAIAWKYLIYGMLAAVLGSLVGAVIGTTLIPWVIFTSYGIMYTLPELRLQLHWGLCLGAAAAGLVCTVGATLWAMMHTARQTPAVLMRPKSPKAGKRVILERITPLWRRMTFSMKVSARNLLRYQKRFWMTVIGVAGCTALLISGLGLRSSLFRIIDVQYGEIYRYSARVSLNPDVENAAREVGDFLARQEQVQSTTAVQSRAVTFSAGKAAADGYLMVTDDPQALCGQIDLRDMAHGEPVAIPENGVVIDEKLAELLDLSVGEELTVDCGTLHTAPVAGIVENYVYHYAYLTADSYAALTGDRYQPNEVLITTGDPSPEALRPLCESLMEMDAVQSTSNLTAAAKSFRESMEVVDAAVTIIVLSAAALALVVLYNLTNINITERIRELATIKVLGFFDGEVAMYIYRENIVLTVLGIALGQLLGKFLCGYLIRTIEMDFVMFGREPMAGDYVLSVALSVLFALMVNFLMYFRMKKIDMVQSLKSVE